MTYPEHRDVGHNHKLEDNVPGPTFNLLRVMTSLGSRMKEKQNSGGDSKEPAAVEQPTPSTKSRSASTSTSASSFQTQKRTSWSGNGWRGKANAVAEIARESIPGSTADIALRTTSALRSPSQRLSRSLNAPGKSNPSPASATPLHVTSDVSSEDRVDEGSEKVSGQEKAVEGTKREESSSIEKSAAPCKDGSADEIISTERPMPAAGWRGWWSKPRQDQESMEKDGRASGDVKNVAEVETSNDASKGDKGVQDTMADENESRQMQDLPNQPDDPTAKLSDPSKESKPQRSSWFGLWGTGASNSEASLTIDRRNSAKGESVEASSTNVEAAAAPSQVPEQTAKEQLTSRPASGSWAFWSREKPQVASKGSESSNETRKEVGELAVSGTDSQSKPRPAQLSQDDAGAEKDNSKKRSRPQSSELDPGGIKKKSSLKHASSGSTGETDIPPAMQQSVLKTTVEPPKRKSKKASQEQGKQPPSNTILPSFHDSYRVAPPTSYLSRLSRYIPYGSSINAPKNLYRSTQPQRIKRALAIGVHGYFPTAIIQKFLGPPTGTSIKFADSAAAAIQQYCSHHAYTANIEKVALEGEGTVDQRIDSLWKLLLNWIDAIRHSDFILVACHSQGVPVAVGLVARLQSFGCVGKDTRIGICAMAGISLGPFASYQSRFLPAGSSTAELFQFSMPNSAVSLNYTNALNTCLRHNVRILYVGSLDDQLVSLDSSTFGTAAHPYISRAVFIDGREHPDQEDFLTRLVGFALKLRNLGISDHGLIRELSGPLAGSLYSGEGHSRIYEEEGVYDLAVRLAAETETLDPHTNPHLEVKKPTQQEENPYFLPWAVRGVLEEEDVKQGMKKETDELLGSFERWRPQSKTLKDVRFRLEAVRSKL